MTSILGLTVFTHEGLLVSYRKVKLKSIEAKFFELYFYNYRNQTLAGDRMPSLRFRSTVERVRYGRQ